MYTPAGAEQELLGYLNLEKGQFSIRRDVTTDQLHLAVLAMFSVLNFEEAVEEERKLLKTFEVAQDRDQKPPEENPAAEKEGAQTVPKTHYSEPGPLGTQAPVLQLFGTGEATEEFVIVGDNNTQTYFGSTGVQELVRRATAPSTTEPDSGSDSDSSSGSDSEGIQEFMRRTSRGWRRCSALSLLPPVQYLTYN